MLAFQGVVIGQVAMAQLTMLLPNICHSKETDHYGGNGPAADETPPLVHCMKNAIAFQQNSSLSINLYLVFTYFGE
jgi:hypothetical protein